MDLAKIEEKLGKLKEVRDQLEEAGIKMTGMAIHESPILDQLIDGQRTKKESE